jgi:hypothetical protein
LEAHETLTIERGFFERAAQELKKQGKSAVQVDARHYMRFRAAIFDVERISREAKLVSTQRAAARLKSSLEQAEKQLNYPRFFVDFSADSCGKVFQHLMDIISRMRDDCVSHLYFQIAPENVMLLEIDADHFGPEVRKAFGDTVEDVAEAASCLGLERSTACVFHLMRALEAAAAVVASKIGATVTDVHGRGLGWGIIADNMKAKIDKMPKGSDEQTKWYRVQSFLEVVNRAWRVPHRASEENLHSGRSQKGI